jgi:hypothetical protein
MDEKTGKMRKRTFPSDNHKNFLMLTHDPSIYIYYGKNKCTYYRSQHIKTKIIVQQRFINDFASSCYIRDFSMLTKIAHARENSSYINVSQKKDILIYLWQFFLKFS